jgi:hypothetical protein
MIRSVCLAAAAALLLAVPSSASAFYPYYGFGYPWGVGYGYGYTANYGGYIPAPPYYSVFPPVYYSSQITKRHYGASPYAWPAGMQPITYIDSAPPAVAEPQMIENPHVQGARRTGAMQPAEATIAEVKSEAKPQMIENPFVQGVRRASAMQPAEVKPLMVENPFVVKAGR